MSQQPSPNDLIAQGRALMIEKALVAGRWRDGEASPIAVEDPAEETVLGHVPSLGGAAVEQAIEAAARAFPDWAARKGKDRGAVLARWAALIEANENGLAALISLENGKPWPEALGEVRYANSFITWFAGMAERLDGRTIESAKDEDLILAFREPVGPVAAITPWNFPAAMITRKAAAAFCAGCTMVLKPASATPFTALALARLALEAGLPEGCFSVVTGANREVGGRLTGSPLIRKLSFTGSTEVGRRLAEQCAPTLKRLSMELGGAAPLIVFEDADIDQAVEGTVAGKFRAAGQTCVCPNRIYVHEAVREDYLERLTARVSKLKVGKPFEDGVVIGPLIDAKGLDKVEDHIARTKAAGGRVLTGGARHELGGRFFQPTVLAGGDDRLFAAEETFGPVAPVFAFLSEEEALTRANASEFGLAAFLFTRDLDRAMRAGRALEAGIIGVNSGFVSNAANPFGGVKQSGYGREGSVYGLDDYLQVKSLTLALG
ncbi:NAD-dependent succinate-semialdehyde dehydrogenase [Phenylobacterium sp.]|uniref:NAD-dependent succinate-semialdehyde dehydrogenase n=1 Tax=Phenylobacterium sp. TaxID=1871053 RepID=UPI0019B54666|nr:NAD-dependent succinate-semialdehyde dehydrogenase [Phenylobacterium sp.]MBC7166731.1 NAD-dependent succinate-semialdehyde dehydrogenase [Phenylobacterium sp.]